MNRAFWWRLGGFTVTFLLCLFPVRASAYLHDEQSCGPAIAQWVRLVDDDKTAAMGEFDENCMFAATPVVMGAAVAGVAGWLIGGHYSRRDRKDPGTYPF